MSVLAKSCDDPLERGIAALRKALGEAAAEALLQPTATRSDEAASFLFPLPIDYTGVQRHLRIGFPKNFPAMLIRLHVEPSPWLVWPHAMKSGLCLHGFRERPITGSPETIVRDSFSRLARIFSLSQWGSDDEERETEFQNEITSYWAMQHGRSLQNIILLERPKSASELFALSDPRFAVPSGQETVWLATAVPVIKNHLARLIGRSVMIRSPEVPGFYVKLQTYPDIRFPDPDTLFDWLTPHLSDESSHKLIRWFDERGSLTNRWIVLELPGDEGSSIYCLNLRSGSLQPDRGPRYGLRTSRRGAGESGKSSPKLIQSSTVDILDRSTTLSRDLNGVAHDLADSYVVVVGVGSLGGAVAAQLARSGVGRITLIDPETLVSENIGRHVLGADDLGKLKVSALRDKILRDLPTVEVAAYANYAEALLYQKTDLFDKANLVIVTTADWGSEVAFWRVKSQGATWGLLQAWSEPYTQVGHALVAPSGSFDARYLFEDNGNFFHKYTEWPDGGIVPLPACGESFIPGGSLGMTTVASMVSQTALRALTGGLSNTTWVTSIYRPQDVAGLGGQYLGPALSDGVQQTTLERKWPDQKERAV